MSPLRMEIMTEKDRYILALSKSRSSGSEKQRRLKRFAATIYAHGLWLQFMGLIETSELKSTFY